MRGEGATIRGETRGRNLLAGKVIIMFVPRRLQQRASEVCLIIWDDALHVHTMFCGRLYHVTFGVSVGEPAAPPTTIEFGHMLDQILVDTTRVNQPNAAHFSPAVPGWQNSRF